MDDNTRRKLFLLAADGNLEAFEKVIQEAIRLGIPLPGNTQVLCKCGKELSLVANKHHQCDCGVRWSCNTEVKTKEAVPSPQHFGGIDEKNSTHTHECYSCRLWFPTALQQDLDDYHNHIYESFCPACLKERNTEWKKVLSGMSYYAPREDPFDSFP